MSPNSLNPVPLSLFSWQTNPYTRSFFCSLLVLWRERNKIKMRLRGETRHGPWPRRHGSRFTTVIVSVLGSVCLGSQLTKEYTGMVKKGGTFLDSTSWFLLIAGREFTQPNLTYSFFYYPCRSRDRVFGIGKCRNGERQNRR